LGGDSMSEIIPRYRKLRKANLNGLQLSGKPQIWWKD